MFGKVERRSSGLWMECSGMFGEVRRCSGTFGKVRRSSKNIPVDGSRQARTELALLLLQLAEPQRQSHNSTAFAKASVRLPPHRDATRGTWELKCLG